MKTVIHLNGKVTTHIYFGKTFAPAGWYSQQQDANGNVHLTWEPNEHGTPFTYWHNFIPVESVGDELVKTKFKKYL